MKNLIIFLIIAAAGYYYFEYNKTTCTTRQDVMNKLDETSDKLGNMPLSFNDLPNNLPEKQYQQFCDDLDKILN